MTEEIKNENRAENADCGEKAVFPLNAEICEYEAPRIVCLGRLSSLIQGFSSRGRDYAPSGTNNGPHP